MAGEDDLEVKMRVVLDGEDVKKQAAEAERKVSDEQRRRPPPPPGAAGATGTPPPPFKDLATAIASAIRQSQEKLAGGKFSAFGEMAMPMATAALGLNLLTQLKEAIRSVISNLLSLGQSLSRFNPELAVAFRQFSVQMRLLSIDMGRVLGPAISELVRAISELVRSIYYALRPVLHVVAQLIKGVAVGIQFFALMIRRAAEGLAILVWGSAKLLAAFSDLVGTISPTMGFAMRQAAQALQKSAEAWIEALEGKGRPQSMLNVMLIRGLTEAASQRSQVPRAAAEVRRGLMHAPAHDVDPKPQRRAASESDGRVPLPSPRPRLASIVNNVRNTTEVRLESEAAISRMMEDVRRQLTATVLRVRNDQLMLANRLGAETVVDLVA